MQRHDALSSSARCAPHSGSPFVSLLLAIVGRRQVVDAGQERAENFRLLTMPPTAMPPKPTP
jgi:hypothetical protein